jgi:hypothetical protein
LFLAARVKALEGKLSEITCKLKFFQRTKRWLLEDSFGTIDHVSLKNFLICSSESSLRIDMNAREYS